MTGEGEGEGEGGEGENCHPLITSLLNEGAVIKRKSEAVFHPNKWSWINENRQCNNWF